MERACMEGACIERACMERAYSWYLPNYVEAWRCGDSKEGLAQIVVTNRPESLVEAESVDFDIILGSAKSETEPTMAMADVMAAISGGGGLDNLSAIGLGGAAEGEIDRFLQRKDLRITLSEDGADEGVCEEIEEGWELHRGGDGDSFEDNLESEELANIYMSQGLYVEAKEIYSRLFLLYSEKSVYFAAQIDKIESFKEKNN